MLFKIVLKNKILMKSDMSVASLKYLLNCHLFKTASSFSRNAK